MVQLCYGLGNGLIEDVVTHNFSYDLSILRKKVNKLSIQSYALHISYREKADDKCISETLYEREPLSCAFRHVCYYGVII